MPQAQFQIQGSSGNTYSVVFIAHEGKLSAHCSCPAGTFGTHCKHRINILSGSTKGILSDNEEDVQLVGTWLIGTPLESALNHYKDCLDEVDEAKRKLNRAKRAFARLLSEM